METTIQPETLSVPTKRRRASLASVASELFNVLKADKPALLTGLSWNDYLEVDRLRDEMGRKTRLIFDNGKLEIMCKSFFIGNRTSRLHSFVLELCMEWDCDVLCAGSTTLLRPDLKMSIEPDECFYLANANRFRPMRNLELPNDPPPDLAIELFRRHSSLDKLPIYARLGVPEVWVWGEEKTEFFVLDETGTYRIHETSLAFPALHKTDLARLMAVEDSSDLPFLHALRERVQARKPTNRVPSPESLDSCPLTR